MENITDNIIVLGHSDNAISDIKHLVDHDIKTIIIVGDIGRNLPKDSTNIPIILKDYSKSELVYSTKATSFKAIRDNMRSVFKKR